MPYTIPHSIAANAAAQRKSGPFTSRRSARLLVILLLPALVLCSRSFGDSLTAPVASRNLSPIYQHLGVPVLQDARNLMARQWQNELTLHWASHSVRETTGTAVLEFDGETQRYDLNIALGVGRGVQLNLNIPYIEHRAGQLDSLIDDWHSLWGLPEGSRPSQPQDRLLFSLTGQAGFLLDNRSSGLGDVELGVAAEMVDFAGGRLTGFAQLKLDTGDVADFTGSGGQSYAAGVRWSRTGCVIAAISCHAQLGYAAIDSPFSIAAEDDAFFASTSLVWTPLDTIAIVGQLDWHEVLYTNDPISKPGAPLWGALSLRWQPSDRWVLDAGFSEDFAVGASADITWRFGVSTVF